MKIEIIDQLFEKDLYGYSGKIVNEPPATIGFRLMDKMWQTVKAEGLKTRGINYWVYGPGGQLFAGVELLEGSYTASLEHIKISLNKYAYYKHIGPYNQLGNVYTQLTEELKSRGLKAGAPYIEIYGHHSPDESKCESEVLQSLV